jgi:hypothetical protein
LNLLRRIYLLLVSLLLVIVVLALLLSPEIVVTWVGRVSELSPVIRILVAVVLGAMLLALMFIQVRPDPRSSMTGLMMRGSGAVTEVSIESARDRILNAVNAVPDVVSAEAEVKPVQGKADIEMQVVVLGSDVKLPTKQKEINRALNQVIDKQLGLRMAGQPRIHIRLQDQYTPKPTATPSPVIVPPVKESPVLSTPVPPAIVPIVEPKVAEPEPESKSSGGLFDRWLGGGKEEPDDATIQLPDRPVASLDEPLIVSDPHPPVSSADDEKVVDFSSLVSEPISLDEASTNLEIPAKPVIVEIDDEKTLKLDLDEELSHSAIGDFDDVAQEDEDSDTESDSSEPSKSDLDKVDEDRPPFA